MWEQRHRESKSLRIATARDTPVGPKLSPGWRSAPGRAEPGTRVATAELSTRPSEAYACSHFPASVSLQMQVSLAACMVAAPFPLGPQALASPSGAGVGSGPRGGGEGEPVAPARFVGTLPMTSILPLLLLPWGSGPPALHPFPPRGPSPLPPLVHIGFSTVAHTC